VIGTTTLTSGEKRTMNEMRADILPMVPHLRAFARSLTAGNVDQADDLVQDTLLQALKAWQRFTPGTNLKAWLFTILHNRFRSVVSRMHVKVEVASDNLERLASVPAFQEGRVEVLEFKLAFARLTPAHREVLVLHAVHGLPYERVAEICGCKVGTVKSRINRARNLLKRMLLGEFPLGQSLHTPRCGLERSAGQHLPRCSRERARQPDDRRSYCPGRQLRG
jgi:RNA polymerase sigma-70 factor, ECF subfamily